MGAAARSLTRTDTGDGGGGLYIPSLDGLRAVAFTIVFAAHAGVSTAVPGGFGVTLFFFLSGYLITTLLRIELERTGTVSLKHFYLRRALRILPPFYLVLGISTVLAVVGVLKGAPELPMVLSQVLHFSNFYIVANGYDGQALGTGLYWSLAVEEHFYLLFPLTFLLLNARRVPRGAQLAVLLGICAVALAWRYVLVVGFNVWEDRTYIATDTRLDSILIGCILALYGNPMLDRTRIADRIWKWLLFPLGIALLLFSFAFRDPVFRETLRYTVQGLALVPIFIVAIRYPGWGLVRLLNIRWVRYLGVLSYSMYLMHHVLIYALDGIPGVPWLALRALALVLTIVLAAIINRLIERPCARLRKKLSHTAARPTEPSPVAVEPAHRPVAGPTQLPLNPHLGVATTARR